MYIVFMYWENLPTWRGDIAVNSSCSNDLNGHGMMSLLEVPEYCQRGSYALAAVKQSRDSNATCDIPRP